MNINAIMAFAGAAIGAALGLGAVSRQPRTIAQYALALGLFVFASEALLNGFTFLSRDGEQRMILQMYALLTTAALPGPWLLFSVTYSRGNWKTFLKKWRLLIIAAFVIPVATAFYFHNGCIEGLRQTVGADWFLDLRPPGSALVLFVLLSSIFVLMNLERTFRASVGTMRWRIKYMVLGLGLLFGTKVYTSGQMLLYSGISSGLMTIQCVALLLTCGLIGLAAIRAGLIEVDVYPSQSLIQHSITIVIAGLYLFAVGVMAKLLKTVAGDAAFSIHAFLMLLSLVGVAIILFSERLRERLKRMVSRHFKRPHYDYREVWLTFTNRTASILDTHQLCRASTQWLSENLRVLSVTLWLVEESKNQVTFGASTTITEDKASHLPHFDVRAASLIAGMRNRSGPFEIEAASEEWVEALKEYQPDAFRSGGSRICARIIAGGELMGFMILGDRVNGVPFSIEDLDLLQCMANQLAGNLLNIRLSQQLMQAREMEAFQTISAFFVHDLKNTASTLSLMLQNLPAHFDDPEFRKDALRGLAKSVDRINELIGRLSLLRQEIQLAPSEVDLNELVRRAVSSFDGVGRAAIERMLASDLPKVKVDPDKIQKVVSNLLTNAIEATGENSRISVATSARNGWADISVEDNGCGMSPEFVKHSLFRPFQTTKKKGVGIGMFLSKMVVEAHAGKIEVDSQPGKGTTFHVLLPIEKEAS
jgi:putative PEP-CTERM system histidine kinase